MVGFASMGLSGIPVQKSARSSHEDRCTRRAGPISRGKKHPTVTHPVLESKPPSASQSPCRARQEPRGHSWEFHCLVRVPGGHNRGHQSVTNYSAKTRRPAEALRSGYTVFARSPARTENARKDSLDDLGSVLELRSESLARAFLVRSVVFGRDGSMRERDQDLSHGRDGKAGPREGLPLREPPF